MTQGQIAQNSSISVHILVVGDCNFKNKVEQENIAIMRDHNCLRHASSARSVDKSGTISRFLLSLSTIKGIILTFGLKPMLIEAYLSLISMSSPQVITFPLKAGGKSLGTLSL